MLIGVMHTSMRINSLGLVAFQLMGCNKQCKMLSNFLPSYDTLSRELKIRHKSHQRVGKTRRWKKEGSPAGWRPAGASARQLLCTVPGSAAAGTDTTRPRDNECDEGRKRKLTTVSLMQKEFTVI